VVARVGRRAGGVIVDGRGRATEGVIQGPGVDAPGVDDVLDPAGGVVDVTRWQHAVRGRRRRARACVGGAAVGADIDRSRQAVRRIVVVGGVGDAGARAGAGVAQRPGRRLVVEALAVDGFDRVAVAVVQGLRLLQDGVAADGVGRVPVAAA